jgi:hypothetical protein
MDTYAVLGASERISCARHSVLRNSSVSPRKKNDDPRPGAGPGDGDSSAPAAAPATDPGILAESLRRDPSPWRGPSAGCFAKGEARVEKIGD